MGEIQKNAAEISSLESHEKFLQECLKEFVNLYEHDRLPGEIFQRIHGIVSEGISERVPLRISGCLYGGVHGEISKEV